MTGKITLESLNSTLSPGKDKRSKSAPKNRKGSKGGNDRKLDANQMGLGRESKSAGFDAAFEQKMEDPSNRKTYSMPELAPNQVPQAYKSPYEPAMNQ